MNILFLIGKIIGDIFRTIGWVIVVFGIKNPSPQIRFWVGFLIVVFATGMALDPKFDEHIKDWLNIKQANK